MMTLLRNCNVFTPNPAGVQDILMVNERIIALSPPPLEISTPIPVNVIDCEGRRVVPGFVDGHTHFAGAGGGSGPESRSPDLQLSEFLACGTTTAVGMLGLDASTRDLPGVLAKSRALTKEGLSAYILIGSYEIPPVTFTGSLRKDLLLVREALGVGEIAISDERSSQPTVGELARILSEAYMGGRIAGKAGVTVLHVGEGRRGLGILFQLSDETDVPVTHLLPTHLNRARGLVEDGLAWVRKGGRVDLTTGVGLIHTGGTRMRASAAAAWLVSQGAPVDRISFTSDANGVYPRLEGGQQVGLIRWPLETLWHEARALVMEHGWSLEDALRPVTANTASFFGLHSKGIIASGVDADFVVLDDALQIHAVFARGRPVVVDGRIAARGAFDDGPAVVQRF